MKSQPFNAVELQRRFSRWNTRLLIMGRLDADTTGRIWRESTRLVRRQGKTVDLDASGIEYCDGSGIALLVYLRNYKERAADN